MKYIQLKDNEQEKLYPYTRWKIIEGMPDLFQNYTTPNNLINILLTSIPGYDASKTQILKQIQGNYQWVDE